MSINLQRYTFTLAGAFVILVLSFSTVLPQGAKSSAPSQAVNSFYRFHLSHNMDFTKRNVIQRRGWLTPELYGLLLNEFKREDEYSKTHLDEMSYMQGDPFTDSEEYPTSFRVGKSTLSGEKAQVEVTFLWGAKSSRGKDSRDSVVELAKDQGKWLVSNIIVKKESYDLRAELRREKYMP
jgi:hypothetical protein